MEITQNIERKNRLGFWMLSALVAGNMIGSGVFLLPTVLAPYAMIGMSSWLVTAIGSLFLALVFAKLSQWHTKVGGPYAYCRDAFGDFIGFQVAYNYWIGLWVGNAAIVIAFVGYMGVFFPILTHSHMASFITSVTTVWLLTFINIIGVRHGGVIQLATTILKLLPLICIGTLGFFYINPSHFHVINASSQTNLSALTSAATLTLWAFIGLESATVPASEVHNPQRTIARATIFGLAVATVVYIASSLAVFGIVPLQQLIHSNAPYADAAKIMFGRIGEFIIAAGAAISAFGTLNGWILLEARVPLAAAQDGLFPKSFAKVGKTGTPVYSLLISAVLITLLLVLTLNEELKQQFTFITLLAVLATLIPYLLSSMAFIVLYIKRQKHSSPKFGARILIIVAILAFIYSFGAFIGAGKDIVYYGMLLFFTGIPVYVWNYWTRRNEQ